MSSNKQSLLYYLHRPETEQRVYLFGTMHIVSKSFLPKLNPVFSIIQKCDVFALEVDISQIQYLDPQLFMLPDGKHIQEYMSIKHYKKLKNIFLKAYNINLDLVGRMLPMQISNLIAQQQIGGVETTGLDENLFQYALEQEIPVTGLESIEENMTTLANIPISNQIDMLIKSSKNISASHKKMKQLSDLYQSGDIQKLARSANKQLGKLKSVLLYDRNRTMADRLETLSSSQKVFAAVGAGHLPGEKGMLRILKHKGFKIKPIPYQD